MISAKGKKMKTIKTGAGKLSSKLLTKLLALTMFCGIGTVMANEIYMEQVGDNSTVSITQDGSNNRIGTALDPAFIGSGSNTVTIDQIGSANELDMIVNGTATDVTLLVTGSNNLQTINCGTVQSASCNGSNISQTIVGDSNIITTNLGGGANHTSVMNISGDTNNIAHTSTNTGTTSADITVTGNTNLIGVTQSGTTAKSVTVNSTGNSNNISINQSN
jgi:hypothetical protein